MKNWRGTSVYIGVGWEGLKEGEQSLARAATGRGRGAVNFRIEPVGGMNECQLNLLDCCVWRSSNGLESARTAAARVCAGEASAEGWQASLSLIEGRSLNEKTLQAETNGRDSNGSPTTWIASLIRELEEGLEVGFLYIVIEDSNIRMVINLVEHIT
jgi:hypothetical protein